MTRCSILSAAVRIDQDGQGGVAGAQAAQHFQAGQLRQAKVQDEQVERLGRQRRIGGQPVAHGVHGIAVVAQGPGQAVGQNAVVFGDQDTHGLLRKGSLYRQRVARLLPLYGRLVALWAVRRRKRDETPGSLGILSYGGGLAH